MQTHIYIYLALHALSAHYTSRSLSASDNAKWKGLTDTPADFFFLKKTHMASPPVRKIFIWYLWWGTPECKVTTLLPTRPHQGREAQESLAWALCWLLWYLSSFEGRMPVAQWPTRCQAASPMALVWAWLPRVNSHPHSGYSCNRIPPTVDRRYEPLDGLGGCGSKARWAGGVMQSIFIRHELYIYTPDQKRSQHVQNPCLTFYMAVSMWETSIFLL